MSAGQRALFPHAPPASPPRGLLDGLNPELPEYARAAATLIAALRDAGEIERALAEVVPPQSKMVLALAIIGIAARIARLPDLEARRTALAALPEALRQDVEPHVSRLFAIRRARND